MLICDDGRPTSVAKMVSIRARIMLFTVFKIDYFSLFNTQFRLKFACTLLFSIRRPSTRSFACGNELFHPCHLQFHAWWTWVPRNLRQNRDPPNGPTACSFGHVCMHLQTYQLHRCPHCSQVWSSHCCQQIRPHSLRLHLQLIALHAYAYISLFGQQDKASPAGKLGYNLWTYSTSVDLLFSCVCRFLLILSTQCSVQ